MNASDSWDILCKDAQGHFYEHLGQRGHLAFRLEDIRKIYALCGTELVAQWAVPAGYGLDPTATPEWTKEVEA